MMICYNLGRYENHRNASVAWTQLDKQIRIQSPRLVDLVAVHRTGMGVVKFS